MLKAIKYEIKSSYKYFLTILLGMLVSNMVLYGYFFKDEFSNSPSFLKVFLMAGVVIVLVASFFVFIFMIISSFMNEFYTDKGYFTFSRPLSGSKFLGSKLWTAIFWELIFMISFFIVNILSILIFEKSNILPELISGINMNIIQAFIVNSYYLIVSLIFTLLLVYLSIVITKVFIKRSKSGYMWFVVFIVLNMIFSIFDNLIHRFFPYYLHNNSIIFNGNMDSEFSMMQNTGLNLGVLILLPFISLAIFYLTSYLIDKKVEI